VPLGGFYEWKKLGGKDKQPYAITLWDLALARGGNRAHRNDRHLSSRVWPIVPRGELNPLRRLNLSGR
jgi:hypothetical protein